MVQAFIYKQIKCKKNKSLVWYIGGLTIETMHDITERLNDRTILLTFFLWSLYDCSMKNRSYILLLLRPIER